MRLESIPLALGIVVMLLGLVLIADGLIPDGAIVPVERRRAPRAARSILGQALFGAAMVSIAGALLGGDQWRFTTLAVILAVVLAAVGVVLNWQYLRSMVGAQISPRQQVTQSEIPVQRVAAVEPEVGRDNLAGPEVPQADPAPRPPAASQRP
jgi:hypothetical protein